MKFIIELINILRWHSFCNLLAQQISNGKAACYLYGGQNI